MLKKGVKRDIIIAMIKALAVGLMVPLFVVSLTMLALFLFESLHVFMRAFLMTLFGLAGFGLGTIVTLRLLERIGLNLQRKSGRRDN